MEIPKVDRCFLCSQWKSDKQLFKILVPDQSGWIQKRACQTCLIALGNLDMVQEEPEKLKLT